MAKSHEGNSESKRRNDDISSVEKGHHGCDIHLQRHVALCKQPQEGTAVKRTNGKDLCMIKLAGIHLQLSMCLLQNLSGLIFGKSDSSNVQCQKVLCLVTTVECHAFSLNYI